MIVLLKSSQTLNTMEKFRFIKDLNHTGLGQTLKDVRDEMVCITISEMLEFASTLKAPTLEHILDSSFDETLSKQKTYLAFNLIYVCQALGLCDELSFFLKLHKITPPICDVIDKPLECTVDNVSEVLAWLWGIGDPCNTGLEQWFSKFGCKRLLFYFKNTDEVAFNLIEKSKNNPNAKALLDSILSLEYLG
jgi:hypothetical protein